MTKEVAVSPNQLQRLVPSLLVGFGILNIIGGGAIAWFDQHEFEQRVARAKEADALLAEFNHTIEEKFADGGIAVVNKATNRPTEVRPADFSLAGFAAGCGAVCTSMGFMLSSRNRRLLKNAREDET